MFTVCPFLSDTSFPLRYQLRWDSFSMNTDSVGSVSCPSKLAKLEPNFSEPLVDNKLKLEYNGDNFD